MKEQHRVLDMLALLSVIAYPDRGCIAAAGPRMQDDLHVSPEMLGWVTSIFFLSDDAFEIPTGALDDRIGPRRVPTRILMWWSPFTSPTGAVTSYPVLLLAAEFPQSTPHGTRETLRSERFRNELRHASAGHPRPCARARAHRRRRSGDRVLSAPTWPNFA